MFHFPTFPPHALCVQAWVTGHDPGRVSPFGNPRITARLAAPRGLSQPPTSFIGSWCQGIHRAPLLTWPQRCSRPLCSSQDTGGAGPGVAERAHTARLTAADRAPGRLVAAISGETAATVVPGLRAGDSPGPSGPNSVPRPALSRSHRSGRRTGCTRCSRGGSRPTGQ